MPDVLSEMDGPLQRLLRGEVVRHFGGPDAVPDSMRAFLHGVERAFRESDLAREALRDARERQAHQMEAIGRLAGGVAHDFNNLLTVILGNADMLTDMDLSVGVLQPIEDIQRAAESASALTRQLLAFGRQQVLQPSVFDLNDLVGTSAPLLRRLVGEGIAFDTNLAPEAGSVRADAAQMQQVLLNLAINARDAMPSGGRLSMSTARRHVDDADTRAYAGLVAGDYAMLTVSDTGAGMAPDVCARVFEPFFTTKMLGRGAGLGLATVYGIVKQSGGFIYVSSEPGRGTTFHLLLPLVAGSVRGRSASEADEPSMAGGFVLVVEDEPAVRRFACACLRRAGYTVFEAGSGPAAIELLPTLPHLDLLLTDIAMPHMDGHQLAARLTAQRPGTRVLYMTGYTGDADIVREIRDGARAVLQKPFRARSLVDAVRQAIDVR